MNVISGMPRSGSTLLCNILNQNEKFFASSTSNLPGMLGAISHNWSECIETKNLLDKEKDKTEKRMNASMRQFVQGWYSIEGNKVIFDKSRGWNDKSLMLKHLYPSAKIIVCIRDLRNVFSSIEKQHRKNPLVDAGLKCIYDKADKMFGPEGMLGSCIAGIEDMIRRQPEGLIFIKYETLAAEPKTVMKMLYGELGLDYYEHDYDNVINTAIDCDGHYLNKFPHKGCGQVRPGDPEEYKKFVAPDIVKSIMERFENYNKYFNYI